MYTYFSGIHILAELSIDTSALFHKYANVFDNNE